MASPYGYRWESPFACLFCVFVCIVLYSCSGGLFLRTSCCFCCHAWTATSGNPVSFLAKTHETFKFTELQWLHAQLDCRDGDALYTCERLLVDAATGASLLQLNVQRNTTLADALIADGSNNGDELRLPASLERCDWIGRVLAHETTATGLLARIQDVVSSDGGDMIMGPWTLDFLYMRSARDAAENKKKRREYSSQKTLLCATAQALHPLPAALHASTATHRLLLVDTTNEDGAPHFYLLQLRSSCGYFRPTFPKDTWARRPFAYSAAMHTVVAEIILAMVVQMLGEDEDKDQPTGRRVLLDPTCGSGTFLSMAMSYDDVFEHVIGWDVNTKCIEGTRANLEHMARQHGLSNVKVHLRVRDIRQPYVHDDEEEENPLPTMDCVVCNLPWGRNAAAADHYDILRATRTWLRAGAPCVFCCPPELDDKELQPLGYRLVGKAHVPPRDFVLPQSNNKKKQHDNDETQMTSHDAQNAVAQSGSCIILVARAI